MSLGLGVFGGIDLPILQADQDRGPIYGAKARIQFLPLIVFEPHISFTAYEATSFTTFQNDLSGAEITAYGIDAVLGYPNGSIGLRSYLFGGVAYYKITNEQIDAVFGAPGSRFGGSGGIGFGIGLSRSLAIDLRGRLNVITLESGGSKKSASLVGGINYFFGSR